MTAYKLSKRLLTTHYERQTGKSNPQNLLHPSGQLKEHGPETPLEKYTPLLITEDKFSTPSFKTPLRLNTITHLNPRKPLPT
jgi:hypothetical protein